MTSLEQLKALFQFQPQRETHPCHLISVGIPRGAITEISGFGKTELVTRFLAENKNLRVAWLEENFSVFPFAFEQRRVDLDRVLFIETSADLAWAAVQVLKAQIFNVVVLYAEQIRLDILRRLQLCAEKSHCAIIWLTDHPQSLWPVSLQLHVEKSKVSSDLDVRILRQRF